MDATRDNQNELIKTYIDNKEYIIGWLRKMYPFSSMDLLNDIMGDIAVKVMENTTFIDHPKNWLLTCAKFRLMDLHRKKGKKIFVALQPKDAIIKPTIESEILIKEVLNRIDVKHIHILKQRLANVGITMTKAERVKACRAYKAARKVINESNKRIKT